MSADIVPLPGCRVAPAIDQHRVLDAMQLLAACTADVAAIAAGHQTAPVDPMDRIMRFTAMVDLINGR